MRRSALLLLAVIALILVATGCRSSSPTGRPPGISTEIPTPCPYAGAIVRAIYDQEADLGKIRDVFVSLGWKQTSVNGPGLLFGTLDGVSVSVMVTGGHTDLSVHVLKSMSEADYPDEDRLAESILRRVKTPVEEALRLPPQETFARMINRGCEG